VCVYVYVCVCVWVGVVCCIIVNDKQQQLL